MIDKILDKGPDLIREAAKSPRALLALTILLISVVAMAFFSGSPSDWVKILIFVLLLLGVCLFGWQVIRLQPPGVTPGPETEKTEVTSDQPESKPSEKTINGQAHQTPAEPPRVRTISTRPPPDTVPPQTIKSEPGDPMLTFDWVTIPAGYFQMGSDKEQDLYASNDEEKHTVYVPEFRIARVPVTVEQFRHFVATTRDYRTTAEEQGWAADYTGSSWQPKTDAYWEHPHGPNSDVRADHPVTCISWHDAIKFCEWAKVRLPSEAEWEKAAGWDPVAEAKYIYPWGNEPPDQSQCNFDMQIGDTTPVGHYPAGASPNGLLDMAGNVWEWTSSLKKEYPYKTDDCENLQGAGDRVVRGGSFFQPSNRVRCAYRHWHKPDATVSDFGFRVCAI